MSPDSHAMSTPAIIPLGDQRALHAGGKAKGLHLLLRARARVPEGFVIPDIQALNIEEDLRAYLDRNFDLEHCALAIRSSALGEDGSQASFAGQYETILNVRGFDSILAAIHTCLREVSSARVRQYAAHQAQSAGPHIPVIVQRMANARCAGVVFTANPVNNRRDRVLINAAAGLGDSLVGGQSAGELYTLSRSGQEIAYSGEYSERLLSGAQLTALREESLRIEGLFGLPADLEWAIDGAGDISWLQLRPITALAPVHLNELDYAPCHPERHLFTRCNVGEMMPGPVTPLTWSVFGRGIDVGLQDFLVHLRVQDRIRKENRFIFMFYNHLFIDMAAIYEIPRKVAFTTKNDVDNNICGHSVEGPEISPAGWLPVRVLNFLFCVTCFMSADRRLRMLKKLVRSLALPIIADYREMYCTIDSGLPRVFEAWAHHYATSGKSGALNSALLRILGSDAAGTAQEHLGTLTGLLTELGGINGALALDELESIRRAILGNPRVRDAFAHESSLTCLRLLQSPESGSAGRLFASFLRNQGHRCVREAELRESDWETDPEALIRILQRSSTLHGRTAVPVSSRNRPDDVETLLSQYSGRTRFIVRLVLPSVLRFVSPERTRSRCASVCNPGSRKPISISADCSRLRDCSMMLMRSSFSRIRSSESS